jgi:putative DNA primase/helicase
MSTTETMCQHALSYARAGIPVIPIHGVLDNGSCTCGAARCPAPGKHPRTKNGLRDATTDEDTIEKWFGPTRWPNANIGGVCGQYLCLDIDAKKDGFESLKRLIESNSPLPDTAVVATGRVDDERGRHYWYRVPDDHPQPGTRTAVRGGIDVRCAGGYAILPPSQHVSGVSYEWEIGTLEDVVDAPAWVLELTPEYVTGDSTWTPDPNFKMSKAVKQFLSGELEVPIGEQRDFLTAAARSILTTGRSVEVTASLLWEGYDGTGGLENCEWEDGDPWTPDHVYALVSDIYAKPPTTPLEKDFSSGEFTFDDAGNAERLIASFKPGHVFHVDELDQWHIWDDELGHFRHDRGGYWLHARWLEITQELARLASGARSEGEATALLRHARTSRMRPRIEATLNLAKQKAVTWESELDTDPYLFGVANGVVDLRTGELREATPGDLITRRSPVVYDPDAKSTLFDNFLRRVVPDGDLRHYLQVVTGYSMTASIQEHAFYYVYGRPASGKTTFLEALKHVMGSYAAAADTSTFFSETQRGPTEDLARLAGPRLVMTHEVDQGQRFSTALVSKIVGGDSIAARFLYGRTFEFHPRFKLWIGANHLPKVAGSTRSGIWRRVKVLPFDQPIEAKDRNPRLPLLLREDEAAQAILAWAVAGAVEAFEHHRKGLIPEPKAVEQSVSSYKRDSDHVNAFAEECLTRTDNKKARVPVADVFKHYLRWCDAEGRDRRETQHALSRKLGDLDFKAKVAWVNEKAQRCWIGVALKDPPTGTGIRVKGARAGTRRKT